MGKWKYLIETNLEIIKYVEVPSGYIYRFIRKSPIVDVGGNKRWEITHETTLHGSMDHFSSKTKDVPKRSLKKEADNTEKPQIRRRVWKGL